MSVNVLVYGADKDSDEYEAALKMRNIIKNSLPSTVNGEIVLYASATLYGQAVKDVDLMMVGNIENYSTVLEFLDEKKEEFKIRENIEQINQNKEDIAINRENISDNNENIFSNAEKISELSKKLNELQDELDELKKSSEGK